MKYLLLISLLTACGTRVSGTTKHEVSGDVEVKVILEVPICDSLEDEQIRFQCIDAFIQAFTKQHGESK